LELSKNRSANPLLYLPLLLPLPRRVVKKAMMAKRKAKALRREKGKRRAQQLQGKTMIPTI
jgi:hypothetical protein